MMKSGLLCLLLLGLSSALHISRDAKWQTFKQTYNKVYSDRASEGQKRRSWEANLDLIERHNSEAEAGLHSFTMGENEYADLSNEEWRQLTGLSINHSKDLGAEAAVVVSTEGLPKSIDWNEKGYVTAMKNQAQCGSCWAFSATGSIEGANFKKTGQLVSLSEQNLVDCDTTSGGCSGGYMDNGFEWVIQNGGIDTEESYAYVGRDGTCQYDAATSGASISSYQDVDSGSESALQRAVGLVGPVSVAIDAGQETFRFYTHGVYSDPNCSTTQLNHGVLATGYGKEESEEYWIIKNSWGTSWGAAGYMKMARNQNNMCGVATASSYPIA